MNTVQINFKTRPRLAVSKKKNDAHLCRVNKRVGSKEVCRMGKIFGEGWPDAIKL